MSSLGDTTGLFINALLAEAEQVATEVLGADKQQATILAEELAVRITEKCGGAQIYISQGRIFKARRTVEMIVREFNGQNHAELALKYKVSLAHVYRIIKRHYEAERARRQGELGLE